MYGIKGCFITASMVATLAFAAPALAKIPGFLSTPGLAGALKSHLNEATKSTLRSQARVPVTECQNFAGHWRGQCQSSDGETFEGGLAIEQYDCDSFYLDGMNWNLGGVVTIGEASRNSVTDMKLYPQWSATRNAINFRGSYSSRALDQDIYFLGRFHGTWRILDDRLISQSSSDFDVEIHGRVSREHSTVECTYTKED